MACRYFFSCTESMSGIITKMYSCHFYQKKVFFFQFSLFSLSFVFYLACNFSIIPFDSYYLHFFSVDLPPSENTTARMYMLKCVTV